jgi:hypothetical protein
MTGSKGIPVTPKYGKCSKGISVTPKGGKYRFHEKPFEADSIQFYQRENGPRAWLCLDGVSEQLVNSSVQRDIEECIEKLRSLGVTMEYMDLESIPVVIAEEEE